MIHVVGNAAIDTRHRRRPLSQARRDDRGARRRPRISAARAPTRRSPRRAAAPPSGSSRRSATTPGRAHPLGARPRRRATEGSGVSPHGTDRCVILVDAPGREHDRQPHRRGARFRPGRRDAARERGSGRATSSSCRAICAPSVTRACLALAKAQGATTVLNPSPTYPASGLRLERSSISRRQPRRGERTCGRRTRRRRRARSARQGAGAVVVTLGRRGRRFRLGRRCVPRRGA